MKRKIQRILKAYNVDCDIGRILKGPTVTRYELLITEGTKLGNVTRYLNDVSRDLSKENVTLVNDDGIIYLELQNDKQDLITFKSLLHHDLYRGSKKTEVILGVDVYGNIKLADFTKWPHILIAGSTGSGKSVGVHQIILSLLAKNSPSELQFAMFDPKQTELSYYDNIPNLFIDTVTDCELALSAMLEIVHEMERRYTLMREEGVRDIGQLKQRLPYIIVIVDELADLMLTTKRAIESPIVRLAQKARACGIHLILSTQRPSVDVLTGLIKANAPTRLSYKTVTGTDSRVILDQVGAQRLLGKGDSYYRDAGSFGLERIQSSYASNHDIESMCKAVTSMYSKAETIIKETEYKPDNWFDRMVYTVLKFLYREA